MKTRRQFLAGKRVLITCGPTWVALDPMRVISNRSTGTMGQELARQALALGAKVTLIEGPVAQPLLIPGVTKKSYQFFDEFQKIFQAEIEKNYHAIIHAAAVSDFRPRTVSRKKISSETRVRIELVPTTKLINKIKQSAPQTCLVGFKLTAQGSFPAKKKAARKLFEQADCDLVVANSLKNGYEGIVLDPQMTVLGRSRSRSTMAGRILKILGSRL